MEEAFRSVYGSLSDDDRGKSLGLIIDKAFKGYQAGVCKGETQLATFALVNQRNRFLSKCCRQS